MRTEAINSPLAEGLKSEFPLRQNSQKKISFGEEFKKTLGQVDSRQKEVDNAVTKAVDGGTEKIHETMINLEEADLSMRLLLKVRSKVLDAYQEIMRMQF